MPARTNEAYDIMLLIYEGILTPILDKDCREAQFIADVSAKTSARGRGATYRTPPPSCVSQCNLPPNDDMVNLATELAAPARTWLGLRNPSSAKRKCRRIGNFWA